MKRSTMEFRWGTSRGAETYGYTTCACRVDGKRLGFCSGGGYDLKGTAFGQALCKLYPDRLKALAEAGKAHGEYDLKEDGAYVGRKIENQRDRLYGMSATFTSKGIRVELDGGCGFRSMENIAEAIGVSVRFVSQRGDYAVYELEDSKA